MTTRAENAKHGVAASERAAQEAEAKSRATRDPEVAHHAERAARHAGLAMVLAAAYWNRG